MAAKRIVRGILVLVIFAPAWAAMSRAEPEPPARIRIKFVHDGAVYLDAGSGAGLAEGQKFAVVRAELGRQASWEEAVAEIEIESVAASSAAGQIISAASEIKPGDSAIPIGESLRDLRSRLLSAETRKYQQIASFTEGAPPEQEIRESIPKPPLPEVNRIRGRIGVDTGILQVGGRGVQSAQFGFLLRLDATRIGSTYWSISGYHRGRFQSRTDSRQQTLSDMINRTHYFSLNYDSPRSNWVAGLGRLFIPWAASLSTMDGFYLGRRFGRQTVGVFGGTNPDPTSWNYDPDRQTAGAFINFERGSFESVRITSTSGVAISRVDWKPDRQFGFFESGIFYKHYLSIHSSVEADLLNPAQNEGRREATFSRSHFTLRLQPHQRVSFDLSQNYYRNIPTFDQRLIGTGLLDRFLFQGLSGGFRLQIPYGMTLYASTGRSSRSGDGKPSWNYLGGITVREIPGSGVRIDYRYSRFDSTFGRGVYQTLTADRQVGYRLRFELQFGRQAFESAFTQQDTTYFINGNADWFLGNHCFAGFGLNAYRGGIQNYNQVFATLGYSFDNRRKRE